MWTFPAPRQFHQLALWSLSPKARKVLATSKAPRACRLGCPQLNPLLPEHLMLRCRCSLILSRLRLKSSNTAATKLEFPYRPPRSMMQVWFQLLRLSVDRWPPFLTIAVHQCSDEVRDDAAALGPKTSAELRDRLLAEMKEIAGADEAACGYIATSAPRTAPRPPWRHLANPWKNPSGRRSGVMPIQAQ